MEITTYIKEHPWTIAAVLGGGFVLYLLLSSGSTGTTGTAVATVDPNQLAADTQLQLAQYQLAGQSQQLQYQLAAQENKSSADVAIATLQAQTAQYSTGLGAQVSLAGIQAQQNVQLAGISSQTQIAQAAQQTEQAQIAATQNIALATAATYAHIADVQSATTIASYQAQTSQAQIAANEQVAIVTQQQKTAQKSSSNSLLSGIVSGVLGIFSDARLKKDIRFIGCDEHGNMWIKYRYLWDDETIEREGVIAQQVLTNKPEAVSVDPINGFYRVNYERLSA